jgi:hypothetical protein
MAAKHPKRPRDFSQAAKLVIDIATEQVEDAQETEETAAIAFARLEGWGRSCGHSQPGERKRIAKKAAKAHWGRKPSSGKQAYPSATQALYDHLLRGGSPCFKKRGRWREVLLAQS